MANPDPGRKELSVTKVASPWLRIPRRPKWTTEMDPISLQKEENISFLEWRRGLALLEDNDGMIITPFERNLEIWRQLWRVMESSSTVVQIVDARNPLMFYCEDLKTYAKELDPLKRFLLLINKADFLDASQRQYWADYLRSASIEFAFYSAKESSESEHMQGDNEDLSESRILSPSQLLDMLKQYSEYGMIGFVGFPNVGKSSTINSLTSVKKVGVSSTPGKTKHFQTVHLPNGVTVLDCPGLVFPSIATSKAELILNGILPIDQLREWNTAVDLLMTHIPVDILERQYSIKVAEVDQDGNAVKLTASHLLSSYAKSRGFQTSFHGNPDESKAARRILKDFVNGCLLYCNPPPGFCGDFNQQRWLAIRATVPLKTLSAPSKPEADLLGERMAGFHITPPISKKNLDTSKHHYKKKRN